MTAKLESATYVGHVPLGDFYTFREYDSAWPEDPHSSRDISPLCAVYEIALTPRLGRGEVRERFCIVKDPEKIARIKQSIPEFVGDQIPSRLDRNSPILQSWEKNGNSNWVVVGDVNKNSASKLHQLFFWRTAQNSSNLKDYSYKAPSLDRSKIKRNEVVEHSINDQNWEGPQKALQVDASKGVYEFVTTDVKNLPVEMRPWVKQPIGEDGQPNQSGNFSLSSDVQVVTSRQEVMSELEKWEKGQTSSTEKKKELLIACRRARKDGSEKLEIWHFQKGNGYFDRPLPRLLMRSSIIPQQKAEQPIVNKTEADLANAKKPQQATPVPTPAKQSFCSWLLTPFRWFLSLFGIKV